MSAVINEEKSAFPWLSHGGVHEHQVIECGLTKREYFAAMAMSGMLSNRSMYDSLPENTIKLLAIESRLIADAMIKEL